MQVSQILAEYLERSKVFSEENTAQTLRSMFMWVNVNLYLSRSVFSWYKPFRIHILSENWFCLHLKLSIPSLSQKVWHMISQAGRRSGSWQGKDQGVWWGSCACGAEKWQWSIHNYICWDHWLSHIAHKPERGVSNQLWKHSWQALPSLSCCTLILFGSCIPPTTSDFIFLNAILRSTYV